jgi:RNA polymerase sigma-70 factor (ECF subfamily)
LSRNDAFEAEALPHLRSLYGTAYRLTRNAHDAQDLVQETCVRALRSFDSYTPGTNIRAWLFTILHRVRVDAIRRAGRSVETVDLADHEPGVRANQDALAAGADLGRALEALPEAFRGAVLLRDVEGFSYEEIGVITGIPVGTVMSRIHRGRALLRQALLGTKP